MPSSDLITTVAQMSAGRFIIFIIKLCFIVLCILACMSIHQFLIIKYFPQVTELTTTFAGFESHLKRELNEVAKAMDEKTQTPEELLVGIATIASITAADVLDPEYLKIIEDIRDQNFKKVKSRDPKSKILKTVPWPTDLRLREPTLRPQQSKP